MSASPENRINQLISVGRRIDALLASTRGLGNANPDWLARDVDALRASEARIRVRLRANLPLHSAESTSLQRDIDDLETRVASVEARLQ
jgi:hypothetical protein